MKKNNLNDFDFIKGMFDEAEQKAPESLNENAILEKITSNANHKRIQFKQKKNIKPFVAAAACVAIAAIAVFAVAPMLQNQHIEPAPNPNPNSSQGSQANPEPESNVKGFASESELLSTLDSLGDISSGEYGAGEHNYGFNVNETLNTSGDKKTSGDYTYETFFDYDNADALNRSKVFIYKNSDLKTPVYVIDDLENGAEADENFYIQELLVHENSLIVNLECHKIGEHGIYDMKSVIRIYDITNPELPKFVSQFRQSGDFYKSFISNGVLYTCSTYGVNENETDKIPKSGKSGEYKTIEARDITCFDSATHKSFAIISAVDPKTCESVKRTKAVIGASGMYTFKLSENNIYLNDEIYYKKEKNLNILRISIDGNEMSFAAMGTIKNVAYSECAINEFGGYVRVFLENTPAEWNYEGDEKELVSNSTASFYVLDMNMEIVSKTPDDNVIGDKYYIGKIGFDGNKAYVYKFEEDKPSFIADFTDVHNIKVTVVD